MTHWNDLEKRIRATTKVGKRPVAVCSANQRFLGEDSGFAGFTDALVVIGSVNRALRDYAETRQSELASS